MHVLQRSGLAFATACAALLCLGSEAKAAGPGVVFVHGTVNETPETAIPHYWSQDTITKMSGGLPYLVVGYPGASCSGQSECAWGPILDQIVPWVKARDISSFTVITHSNGSSPMRYLLGHSGAVSALGTPAVSVTRMISQVIFSAPDFTGTPLVDQVTSSGTFLSVANAVIDFLGGDNYNSPGVLQQRSDLMRVFNSNGTFAGGQGATALAGTPISVVRGTKVHANLFSGDAHCAGYIFSVGLKAAALVGWGDWDADTDGFIGADSAGYFGNIIIDDARLHHHQSRRDCRNLGALISAKVRNASLPPPSQQPPLPDPQVLPSALACNNYPSGDAHDFATGHTVHRYGCSSAQRQSGQPEPDCLVSLGYSSGYRIPSTESWNPYLDPSNYSTWGETCPDSWLGNGVCDACLISKYGFDADVGATGADDCVQAPKGGINYCGVLTWDYALNARNYSIVEALH